MKRVYNPTKILFVALNNIYIIQYIKSTADPEEAFGSWTETEPEAEPLSFILFTTDRNVLRGCGGWKAENVLLSLHLSDTFISLLGPKRREESRTHALLPHTSSGSPAALTHNPLRSWRQR